MADRAFRDNCGSDTELHSKAHRGGDEEPTQAYVVVRRGVRRGDNKDGAKKATWYESPGPEESTANYTHAGGEHAQRFSVGAPLCRMAAQGPGYPAFDYVFSTRHNNAV